MICIINNQRPGVYSRYETLSAYALPRTQKGVGLVLNLHPTLNQKIYTLKNYGAAKELLAHLPENKLALGLCQLLFGLGVSFLVLAPALGDYSGGQALESAENLGGILSDAQSLPHRKELLRQVDRASQAYRERLCFLGESSPTTALEQAGELNHPRCMLVASTSAFQELEHPLFGAAALLAEILVKNQPSYNFNAHPLPSILLNNNYEEETVQALLKAGITPLEKVGNEVQVVRGVTTKTKTDGLLDYSFRSVNTTLIVDDVLSTLRKRLSATLKGATTQNLDSVASQVLLELEGKKKEGLLTAYEPPYIYPSTQDSSVCVVELSFRVAHVLSQIHLVAQILL